MPEQNTDNGQANQAQEQEVKPLFGGTDSQGKERLFTDPEDAAKSWQASQNHIKTLEEQRKEYEATINSLKSQLEQSSTTSEKIDQALELLKNKGSDMQQPTGENQAVDIEALKAELLKQAQETAVNSVTGFKQQEIATANQQASIQAAKDYYGSEYESKLREQGAKLGLNDEAIQSMAKSNPALFKQTFGLTGQKPSGISPDGSVNGALFNGQKPELKELRKQWGDTAKLGALNENVASVEKMLKEANGDIDAVRKALGIQNALKY